MSLTPSFRLPISIPEGVVHSTVKEAIEDHDQAITDLQQAIPALKTQINALGTPTASTSTGTSTTTAVSTQNVTNVTVGGGPVNNQTGVTAYTTAQTDNGALVIFNDASPVAVTLNNSVTLPWYFFALNQGAGLVTLTPQQGLIDGAANATLANGFFIVVFFDGANYWSCVIPSGPISVTATAGVYITGYNAATATFSVSTPAGISATITTAKLTTLGANGSMTFVNGLLTGQTPAT